LNCSDTKHTTLWDIVRAEPELSALRALLANDVPWVAATLDAKKLADDADRETAFPPGAPYDPDAPGLVPLLDERTGAFHVDTLFAPNDAAVEALRTYLLGGGGDAEAGELKKKRRRALRFAEPVGFEPLRTAHLRWRCWARGTPPPRRFSWRTTCLPT
jgi:hypothetical protein